MARAFFIPLLVGVLVCVRLSASAATTTTVKTVAGVVVISGDVTVGTAARRERPQRRIRRVRAITIKRRHSAAVTDESPGAEAAGKRLVQTALAFVGTRYVWGGASPGGFDCSGFTSYVYGRLGLAIPRTADLQFAAGRPVSNPQPGDLVFFQTYDWGASHVGIYLGEWRFVNAIGSNVHVTTFASEYFRSRYLGARRFLPDA